VLDHPTSPTPSFVADLHGQYVAELVVTDVFEEPSQPDQVVVSFENVKPVADAGGNQAVTAGETVDLDASGSSDANGDPLICLWEIVSLPAGSGAAIANPTAEQTSFVADLPGTYVVSLTVNDGYEDSDPDNVTITATSTQSEVIENLDQMVDVVNVLDPGQLKNENMANALTNKLAAALALVDAGEYQEALDKLAHDVLGKTNGCAEAGAPDKNDWL